MPSVEQADRIAKKILEVFPEESIAKLFDKKPRLNTDKALKRYQRDPVGFVEDKLGFEITDDVKNMFESVRDNPATIAMSGNAVGKTHGAACISIWFKKCFPDSQVITAAPPPSERNLKEKLWGEIKMIVRKHPELFPRDRYKVGAINIRDIDDDLSFVTGVTIPQTGDEEAREAKFSGQHRSHLLFVLDEGDAIPDWIYRAIDSCLSGGYGRLLVMFNPKRRSGAAYRKIKEGRANVVHLRVFEHPNVTKGDERIPGAVSRQMTVKRINEWSVALNENEQPDETTCFEVPDFLVGSEAVNDTGRLYPPLQEGWRKVTDPQFYYMVLGRYPAQGSDQLIAEDWINRARSNYDMYVAEFGQVSPKGVRPIIGMDVADDGGDDNTNVPRYGNIVMPIITWRGLDLDLTAMKAADVYVELDAYQINVESDGLGAGIAPRMNRMHYWRCEECHYTDLDKNVIYCPYCSTEEKKIEMDDIAINAKKVKVGSASTWRVEMGKFKKMRDQLWWACREWLRTEQNAALPPDEKLIEELMIPTFREQNGEVKVMGKDEMKALLGRSPDRADGLIETFYSAESRPRVRMLDLTGKEE